MAFLAFLIVLLILGFIWWLLLKIVNKIDDWANSDPAVKDICDFGAWKFHNGFWGYKSDETDRKLRRMYDEEMRNR